MRFFEHNSLHYFLAGIAHYASSGDTALHMAAAAFGAELIVRLLASVVERQRSIVVLLLEGGAVLSDADHHGKAERDGELSAQSSSHSMLDTQSE